MALPCGFGCSDRAQAEGCRSGTAAVPTACAHGVAIVIYPEAVWYGGVTPDDVDELFREHVLNGRPVERLRLDRTPRPTRKTG